MKAASLIFWELAKQILKEMENNQGNEKQLKQYRKVAGQLLFYAGINAIEEKLSHIVSLYEMGNHEQRGIELSKNIREFVNGEQILRRYQILVGKEYNYRRKVAYKGENSNKFQLLKEFADLCIQEIENE